MTNKSPVAGVAAALIDSDAASKPSDYTEEKGAAAYISRRWMEGFADSVAEAINKSSRRAKDDTRTLKVRVMALEQRLAELERRRR